MMIEREAKLVNKSLQTVNIFSFGNAWATFRKSTDEVVPARACDRVSEMVQCRRTLHTEVNMSYIDIYVTLVNTLCKRVLLNQT